jgi:hypothetical protein
LRPNLRLICVAAAVRDDTRVSGEPVISKTFSSSGPERSRAASQSGRVGENREPTPQEGLRLVKAFHRIKEPRLRDAATRFVEGLADTHDVDAAVRLLLG